MGDEAERADVSANSVAVMLPIPAEIAAKFPDLGKSMPPHVTLAYVGQVDPAKVDDVVLIVADEVCERWSDLGRDPAGESWYTSACGIAGHPLTLSGLSYFENDPRVAYASVIAPSALHELRRRMLARFVRIGLGPTHAETWVPHVTLAFIPPGTTYEGDVPSGSWESGPVEVWHGNDVRYLLGKGSVSGVDKIAKEGSRWRAWRDAGKTLVGDFDSEVEARAGLLADDVDRKLTGRWDRSDDEKAEIRSRWQKDGPNMGAARLREWLESPFAGPNRKSGDERERAKRVADRALRLMETSTEDWTNADYGDALQVLAFIERMSKVEQGEPQTIDGREGPSARDASLRDWGFDPKQDAAPVQQVLFDVAPDGSVTLTKGPIAKITVDATGAITMWSGSGGLVGARLDAGTEAVGLAHDTALTTWTPTSRKPPAVHTESRVHVAEVIRADRIELATDHAPIRHPHGWVLYPVFYSRAGNIQIYDGVREYRPREEVFSRASMDTGIGIPWELRHSRDLLNPSTVGGVARGCIVTVDEYHDNDHTFGWARAWDRALLYAIEGDGVSRPDAPEVSVAYACKVDRRPGHDDFGNEFDQRAFNIIWNSLASEPYGRAKTAKVLTGRADAESITVQGAGDLLALASGLRPPASPVVFDRGTWARFDSRSMQRPSFPLPESTPRKDQSVNTTHNLILAAQKLGVADEAIAEAIGLDVAALAVFMEGDEQLNPDQINAMLAILPVGQAASPAGEPAADAEMAKVMIGEAEHDVPKAVAEHIRALESKAAAVQDAKGRADRATKRADAAEAKLAVAETELTKRADALATMVSRSDAEAMVTTYGSRIATAMDLVRRVRGHEYKPETRKDGESNDLPLTAADWERDAIRSAFGDKADAVLARIDAAPNDAARDYAMAERLADASELVDRLDAERSHKGKEALEAVGRMRNDNADADHQDGEAEDRFEALAAKRRAYAEKRVPTTNQPNHGAA